MLNPRIIASALMLALFIVPLLAPLTAVIPASAQVVPLKVTNIVVTAGGELGFILDRSALVAGHQVQVGVVLYAWISKNPQAILVGDEFLVATLPVGGTDVAARVYGTLLVNSTIADWLGAPEGNVYLKITAATIPNFAQAVVAGPFKLIVDPAIIEKTLKVYDHSANKERRDFAYHEYYGFPVSNDPRIYLNLSAIGIGTDVLDLATVDEFRATLVKKDQMLFAEGITSTSDFLTGVSYVAPVTPGYNDAYITGEITDFELKYPEATRTLNGTLIAYQDFSLSLLVSKDSVTVEAPAAEVRASNIVDLHTSPQSFLQPRVSVGWTKTFNIYPSLEIAYDPGPDNRLTVGDSVSIILR
ncbi:MAG: hypothetical protein ACK4H7_04915, partial [Acidilobaceae archaeon]